MNFNFTSTNITKLKTLLHGSSKSYIYKGYRISAETLSIPERLKQSCSGHLCTPSAKVVFFWFLLETECSANRAPRANNKVNVFTSYKDSRWVFKMADSF